MDSVLDVGRIYFLALLFALLIERVMEILVGVWNYFEWRTELYVIWNRKAEKLRKKFEEKAKSQIWAEVLDLTPLARQIRYGTLDKKKGHSGKLLIISGDMIRQSTIAAVSRIVAAALGVVFCWIINLDLISIISVEFDIPLLGNWPLFLKEALSGIIIGLGAEPVHNLISALENRRKSRFQKRELEQALSNYK